MIWAALAFLLVASTKYLTSTRLRNLRDRMQRERQGADDLRRQLSQVAEKESVLKSQTDQLVQKVTHLTSIVANLERALRGPARAASKPSDESGQAEP